VRFKVCVCVRAYACARAAGGAAAECLPPYLRVVEILHVAPRLTRQGAVAVAAGSGSGSGGVHQQPARSQGVQGRRRACRERTRCCVHQACLPCLLHRTNPPRHRIHHQCSRLAPVLIGCRLSPRTTHHPPTQPPFGLRKCQQELRTLCRYGPACICRFTYGGTSTTATARRVTLPRFHQRWNSRKDACVLAERRGERARGREGERARGREGERTRGREAERARGREGEGNHSVLTELTVFVYHSLRSCHLRHNCVRAYLWSRKPGHVYL
jgi:hypothetical protein